MDAASASQHGPPLKKHEYWQHEDENTHGLPYSQRHPIGRSEDGLYHYLASLRLWGKTSSKDPHTWGFALYSATADNERFSGGVEKLDRWIRYMVLMQRYSALDPDDTTYLEVDEQAEAEGKPWPSRDLADRFKLDVMLTYPGKDAIIAGKEVADGEDDFMAIGAHFTQWVAENGLDMSEPYTRNDLCLILDEKSLETLDSVPSETPPLGPDPDVYEDGSGLEQGPQAEAWVWMLDREYCGRYLRGERLGPVGHPEERRFFPWLRIRMCELFYLWFLRNEGGVPSTWNCVNERDAVLGDKVNWWVPLGNTSNGFG